MTTDAQRTPTADEILDEARAAGIDWHKHWNDDGTNRLEIFTHAVIDRWGQPDGEHTNAELQQMLDECYEGKKKCYFAIGQYQTAIDNLIEERDALVKSASSGEPLTDEQIDQAIAELGLNYLADAHATNRAVLRKLCHHAHGIRGGQHGTE